MYPGFRSVSAAALLAVSIACLACAQPSEPAMRPLGIPMRDGVILSADLHLPDGPGPYPVILLRTPYNRALLTDYGAYYSGYGYAVVVQDVRGRFGSEGRWQPFLNEGRDGYDTVEWIAAQQWSTGKVGMIGGSYSGSVQFAAAVERPPHLAAIVPNITPAMPFDGLPYQGGVLQLGWAVRWTDIMENARTGRDLAARLEAARSRDWTDELAALPVRGLDRRVIGKSVGYWADWLEHNSNDDYWAPVRYLEGLSDLDMPVLVQSGWFDPGTRGSKLAYRELEKGPGGSRRLIIGPWSHSDRGGRFLAGEDMGTAADIDLFAEYRAWFDHWLRGEQDSRQVGSSVDLYLMGSNRWLEGNSYPLEGTESVAFYLSEKDESVQSGADGALTREVPDGAAEVPDHYTYNPAEPTPSMYAAMKRGSFERYAGASLDRPDVLVYETAPFGEPLHLAGPIEAKLYAATSAVDTDWSLSLYAVAADGRPYPVGLTFGMLRARFRHSTSEPRLVEPGAVLEYTVDLGHTAITLPPGHRLRLEVASASFPEYSRNLNTGGHSELESDFVAAEQLVYRGSAYLSRVVLPVIDPARYE
jgi:putative CocE/NonD family hydrolase